MAIRAAHTCIPHTHTHPSRSFAHSTEKCWRRAGITANTTSAVCRIIARGWLCGARANPRPPHKNRYANQALNSVVRPDAADTTSRTDDFYLASPYQHKLCVPAPPHAQLVLLLDEYIYWCVVEKSKMTLIVDVKTAIMIGIWVQPQCCGITHLVLFSCICMCMMSIWSHKRTARQYVAHEWNY